LGREQQHLGVTLVWAASSSPSRPWERLSSTARLCHVRKYPWKESWREIREELCLLPQPGAKDHRTTTTTTAGAVIAAAAAGKAAKVVHVHPHPPLQHPKAGLL